MLNYSVLVLHSPCLPPMFTTVLNTSSFYGIQRMSLTTIAFFLLGSPGGDMRLSVPSRLQHRVPVWTPCAASKYDTCNVLVRTEARSSAKAYLQTKKFYKDPHNYHLRVLPIYHDKLPRVYRLQTKSSRLDFYWKNYFDLNCTFCIATDNSHSFRRHVGSKKLMRKIKNYVSEK